MKSISARNRYKSIAALLLVAVMVVLLSMNAFAIGEDGTKSGERRFEASICFDDRGRQFTGSFSSSRQKYLLGNESLGLYVMSLDNKNYYAGANGSPLWSDDNIFGNTDAEKERDYRKGTEMFRTLETIRRYFRKVYGVTADEYLIGLYNDAYDNGNNSFATDDILWSGEVLPVGTIVGIISIGANEDPTDIDMLAHEYMHRVEQNLVGLSYRGEPGAIMEAYSDLFGELVEAGLSGEAPDWIHNEERNLKDPAAHNSPTVYRGRNYQLNPLSDNGGVHKNSTVLTHAAYLMWYGIDGSKARKIDTATLGKLWMRALQQFDPNETFEQCAADIYRTAQTMDLTRQQTDCVALAFKQAGLPVRERDKTSVG